ncbi:MAG: glycine/betaine ABC transporter substrate-binding protein [Cupriavidus sp.]|jgi:osmoprotectant transport system substrate-binding protein|uniref:glycine betaine ABC transporter substrate-binding protein n=1 Tax=Cupriavidus pauculus TaxID=82633 RepID=UPI0007822CB5|nr:glycine betaine ABC transporter substrate-binding protein [Cupriavidus pauculus]MBU68197.1 glycine/betaine ABC transporter substrate-binding protein [Cupriavidus sp.]KAB0604641.1 glycine betaine ABC transporter substrate-binding protein [Cupriavidus pauculus]MBY4729849.1 glycine betaine ABC transporter substrate-binding protein [Cupriavidus pauculus]MCM3607066.1 glycine betaine ABC transporter substrate-binding protein [Cupriavidus pauculus]UAK98923.1 glycine betaine ABC transporter substra
MKHENTRRLANLLAEGRSFWLAAAAGLAFAALLLTTAPARAQEGAGPLRIGGKNFTEQLILSSMTTQYLKAKGIDATLTSGLGSTLMRQAMESGQLDVVWDYTGTALIVFNKVEEKLDGPESYKRVKALDAAKGLVWLDPSQVNNTYAFAMPKERAGDIRTLSAYAEKMRKDGDDTKHPLAVDMEFAARPDGLEPLKAAYQLPFGRKDVIQLDPGLVYTALKNNQVDLGLVYTTDGRVKGFDLVLLEDDLHFFPPYNAVPVVRKAALDAHPELADLLNALSSKLDNAAMTDMNYQVDINQQPVDKVAGDFLRGHGLI